LCDPLNLGLSGDFSVGSPNQLWIREADNAHNDQVRVSRGCRQQRQSHRKSRKVFQQIFEDLKPEAEYFFPEGGERAGLFVVDMKESSEVAEIAERFFFGLNARIEMVPVMAPEDLKIGLSGVQGIIRRYG
jgi:hypothetical protein